MKQSWRGSVAIGIVVLIFTAVAIAAELFR